MVFPVLKGGTTPVFTCVHGGTFKIAGSSFAHEPPLKYVIIRDAITPVSPCPGIPPAGIPPCTFPTGAIATGTKKLSKGNPHAIVINLQISITGFPLIPTSPTTLFSTITFILL